ncbi:MAG TPA: outer membrane beta-barrel protein [Xanthobacteraceae bacterium]|nr:outer membrane beta-barrel protein [Xanthobacteraceae bacterium]
MFSVRCLLSAATAVLASTAAFAADMPQPMPYQPPAMVVAQPEGAWYLRGDIGVGMETQADVEYLQNPLNSSNFTISHAAMGDTTFFMAGVGYEVNNWLRFDVTGEYRDRAPVNFFGSYTYLGTTNIDQYQGFLKSAVFLVNGYIDLGTWDCLTPFIGAGVGGAWNQFADLTDVGTPSAGSGVGNNSSKVNFAWALHAGVAYNVTKNFTVELAYRYLNYGSVTDSIECAGGCYPDSYKLQNLTSNDFMLGMRWQFPVDTGSVFVEQPASYQPAPPPPPPPPQYPLSTRG